MSLDTTIGTSTSESYISVSEADLYHSNRGNTAWAALTTATKEQSLRKATDYMVGTYRLRWKGVRGDNIQVLDWPRWNVRIDDTSYGYVNQVVDPTIVPTEVKNATAELALIASTADLNPTMSQGIVKEIIGPITSVYDQYTSQNNRYPKIERMLAIYLQSSTSSSIRLART